MTHIMIDLETLDTASTAVVTALGATVFDPYSDDIGPSLYCVTNDWAEQQKRGCTISGNTVHWWLEQERDAQQGLVNPPPQSSMSTLDMLAAFGVMINTYSDVELWGNGADFDNVILGHLYQAYGIKRPWSYSRNRCYRTMNSLPKTKYFIEPHRGGVHHNALDDALTQVRRLQAIFAMRKVS